MSSHYQMPGAASAYGGGPPDAPVISKLDSLLNQINDPTQRDDVKLKALQEINNNMESLSGTQSYPALIDGLTRSFIRLLQQDTSPQFIAENNTQQLRKLMLDMTHRMPCSEYLKPYVKALNSVLFKIIQNDNEENVLIALKILMELQKQFRPAYTTEVAHLMQFCKSLYRDLPLHVPAMFEPRKGIVVQDIHDLQVGRHIDKCFTVAPIQTSRRAGEAPVVYTLLPKGSQSLKVVAELPVSIVTFFQMHRSNLQADMSDFVALATAVVALDPRAEPRIANRLDAVAKGKDDKDKEQMSRELYVELVTVQVKALSFLAYLTRMFLDTMLVQAGALPKQIITLLHNCPPEATSLRREMLVGLRHLLGCELRIKFLHSLPDLFNEALVIGNGWTANEQLRSLYYGMLADFVHHVRQSLGLDNLSRAAHVFARCIHDASLAACVQTVCCKLMLNLVEVIVACDRQPTDATTAQIWELLFFMLNVFIRKFKHVAKVSIPSIMERFDPATQTPQFDSDSATPPEMNGAASASAVGPEQSTATKTDSAEAPADEDSLRPAETSVNCERSADELMDDAAGDMSTDSSSTPLTTGSPSKGPVTTAVALVRKVARRAMARRPPSEQCLQTLPQIALTYWGAGAAQMNVSDCRSLVKVLVGAVKTTVWGIDRIRASEAARLRIAADERDEPKESVLFARLLKHGLRCLSIYTIVQSGPSGSGYQRTPHSQHVRSKEEKETLDHFSSVFTVLTIQDFKEIMSTNIEFIVERISENYALQLLPNTFLVTAGTSAAFGNVLTQFLLERLPELGTTSERSALYVKLFKLVFQSVTPSVDSAAVAADNEQMLKPHLHNLVLRSLDLALTTREPGNYFLLLRALFRSIGGGCHDLLYQEFLPLLPTLLQKLNRLQSSAHRQPMRELFVELCLTVPVRLSSLLPYLPLLMDPLVCALNGSPQLVQQGLRTLELCVDNLQPDYLYEHMAPVRASLMRALWNTVSTAVDSDTAAIAFRILGKFGGSNRKMLSDPQEVRLRDATEARLTRSRVQLAADDGNCEQSLSLRFIESARAVAPPAEAPAVEIVGALPIGDAVRAALNQLHAPASDERLFIRGESWRLVKSVLMALSRPAAVVAADADGDDRSALVDDWSARLATALEKAQRAPLSPTTDADVQMFRCSDEQSRGMVVDCITAMFFAVWSKDLRNEVLNFFNAFVRNVTIQLILEETGEAGPPASSSARMDGGTLLDAVTNALADSGKEYCHSAVLALTLIKDTATCIVGTIERVRRALSFAAVDRVRVVQATDLRLMTELLSRVCDLCYRSAWYARLGGLTGVNFVLENFPRAWVRARVRRILRAIFEVLVGLFGEVSNGALDMARSALRLLVTVCCEGVDEAAEERERLLQNILSEIGDFLFSPIIFAREESIALLQQMATCLNESVSTLIAHSKDAIASVVTKCQTDFLEMSIVTQTGFMEAFAFCYSLEPPLFTFEQDCTVQRAFSDELMRLCETDEAQLKADLCGDDGRAVGGALGCGASDVTALKVAAMRALTACYMATPSENEGAEEQNDSHRSRMFLNAVKPLTHGNAELQKETFECMKMALSRVPTDRNKLHSAMRPVLLSLGEHKHLSLQVARRLLYLTRLSPNTFNEKFCEQILIHLKKLLENVSASYSGAKPLQPFLTDDMEACAVILEIVEKVPAASPRLIEQIVPLLTKVETTLRIGLGCAWRLPLVKFLCRHPAETVAYFLDSLTDAGNRRLFVVTQWLVKQKEGKPFREVFIGDPTLIENLLELTTDQPTATVEAQTLFALKLVLLLAKWQPDWFGASGALLGRICAVLKSFRLETDQMLDDDWLRLRIPKTAIKCILAYFRHDPSSIDALFDLVQCFSTRCAVDFGFVRHFLLNEIIAVFFLHSDGTNLWRCATGWLCAAFVLS